MLAMQAAKIVKERRGRQRQPILVIYCRCVRGTLAQDGIATVLEIDVTDDVPELEARRRLLAAWKRHREEKHGGD